MTKTPTLVLGSNSPRRRELLSLGGWIFTVRPADVDESLLLGEAPGEYVLRLAETKVRACASNAQPGETIIAADTTVTIDGDILGKPASAAEAVAMLTRLRGRRHQVFTGIAVKDMDSGRLLTRKCVSEVPMRRYTDAEMQAYVRSGNPLDKAGAYAIQHARFHPVEDFSGCTASVMGLPLCHLAHSLKSVGIFPKTDIPTACQASLHYDCPIHSRAMNGEEVG